MDNLTFHEMICEWANLLEHGSLPQTEGRLHDDAGHCCLGVMCEVLNVKRFENTQIDPFGEYSYGTAYGAALCRNRQILPDVIADKYPQLEVFAGDILLKIPPHLRKRHPSVAERELATELNDSINFSFKEIAECVRYTWPGAFA